MSSPKPSSLRKQGSSLQTNFLKSRFNAWIPAFAGMTNLVLIAILFSACAKRVEPVRKPLEVVIESVSAPPSPTAVEVPQPSPADVRKRETTGVVKVGLRVGSQSVTISSKSPIDVLEADGGKHRLNAGEYKFTTMGNRVRAGTKLLSKRARLSTSGDLLVVNQTRPYRGIIVLVATDAGLTVINEVSIDDYLKGVLPREVVVTWHQESQRVQAVASRTYLASHLGRHGQDGFDLCSDVHCQVYGGVEKEHPECSRAVDATRGEILVWQGSAIGAFFHSNCGGTTEKIKLVWGKDDKPYLPRKQCDYGTGDPRYNWKMTYHDSEIMAMLKTKQLVKGTKLQSVRVKKKSPSGRAEIVEVKTDDGTYDLMGNSFRIALHPEKIRSTLWTQLIRKSGAYEFKGRGWGHGVGMCQWGAKGQAERGRKYEQILAFYYPGTKLQQWKR